jgi:hypothetical protein
MQRRFGEGLKADFDAGETDSADVTAAPNALPSICAVMESFPAPFTARNRVRAA